MFFFYYLSFFFKIDISTICNKWNHKPYLFLENHIDLDIFLKLTEAEINLLVPNSIGQRKKIKSKIAELNEKEKVHHIKFHNEIHCNLLFIFCRLSFSKIICYKWTIYHCHPAVRRYQISWYQISNRLIEPQLIEGAPDEISLSKSVDDVVDNFFLTARPRLPDFDLNTLLQTSPLGNTIINYYKTNSYLDNSHRTRLVDIICKHIYTFIVN